MHVAFRVDADVDHADHIAFLEACATHGQGIVAIRDGAGRTQPCDPRVELETLRRRTRRAIPVCYLVPADLGTRLSDRFRRAIPAQETRPGYASVPDPLIDFVAPRHRTILDDRALSSAAITDAVQNSLMQAGYETLGSLAQASRSVLADQVPLDAAEIDHLAGAIAAELDRLSADRPRDSYPGILRADTLTRPILASVPTTNLAIDESAFEALFRADLTDLALIAECPAPRLMRILKGNTAHLRQVVHVLIAATHAALERWSAPYSLTETPLGLDHDGQTLRGLRHVSLDQTGIPKPLRQRLAKLGYDTLADVVQTPAEIWHAVYGLDMGAIADLQTAAILASTRLTGRPFPGDGRPGSLASFLERHLLADVTGQAPIPDAVARDNPGSLSFDVYAVTPVFAETLALLFEPVGQFAGRPVWYRLDTGPLDADPSLITLAKLCAATLALHSEAEHDLAAAPRGTAH